MPLSESQKRGLAAKYMARYFPGSDPDKRRLAIDSAVDGFSDELSPIRGEQRGKKPAGTGVDWEGYVIYMGYSVTVTEPIGISPERLAEILKKVLTF